MNNSRGKFITFEGGDGCGKTTQIGLAEDYLAAEGYDCLFTREPGGTAIGEKIRSILLDPENAEMADICEMLLYAAARAQIAQEVIGPALAEGRLVICDRWTDSSLVYQGEARGLGEAVRFVNEYAAGELYAPDATILLHVPPEEALARAAAGGGKGDRIEALGVEYQSRVQSAYLRLAACEPERFHVIDAAGSPGEVHDRVKAALNDILAEKCGA